MFVGKFILYSLLVGLVWSIQQFHRDSYYKRFDGSTQHDENGRLAIDLIPPGSLSPEYATYFKKCFETNVKVKENMDEVNNIFKFINQKVIEINEKWRDVSKTNNYFHSLASLMKRIDTHKVIGYYQEDIFAQFDSEVITPRINLIRRVSAEVDNTEGEIKYFEPKQMEDEFLSLTKRVKEKCKTLDGPWLDVKDFLPISAEIVAKELARSIAHSHPDFAKKVLQWQDENNKDPVDRERIKNEWKQFATKVYKDRFNSFRGNVVGKIDETNGEIKKLGSSALPPLTKVINKYEESKDEKASCEELEVESRDLLKLFIATRDKLTSLETRLKDHEKDILKKYGYLYGNATSYNALIYAKQIYDLSSKKPLYAGDKMKDFLLNIENCVDSDGNYDFDKIERLFTNFDEAVYIAYIRYLCYQSKEDMLHHLTADCKLSGTVESQYHYGTTSENLSVLKKLCFDIPLSNTELKNIVRSLKIQSAMQKCFPKGLKDENVDTKLPKLDDNLASLLQLLLDTESEVAGLFHLNCKLWGEFKYRLQRYQTDHEILEEVNQLTLADVQSMTSRCKQQDTTPYVKAVICEMKIYEKKSLDVIKSILNRHKPDKVENAFNEC